MIVEIEKYNLSSKGSLIEILCECDICNKKYYRTKNQLIVGDKAVGDRLLCRKCFDEFQIIGKRVGKLVAIKKVGITERLYYNSGIYEWECDCGNTCIASSKQINSRIDKSCGCQSLEKKTINAKKEHFYRYKKDARKRNIDFNLSIEEFTKLISQDCFYCAIPPNTTRKIDKNNSYLYNGIDRVDNNKGYTIENCVACCKMCNFAKNNYTLEEFLIWIKNVYNKTILNQT